MNCLSCKYYAFNNNCLECIVKLNTSHLAALAKKDNQIVQAGVIVDAIDMILSAGEEPSDFMLSFPLVRAAWDQCQQIAALEADYTATARTAEIQAEQIAALTTDRHRDALDGQATMDEAYATIKTLTVENEGLRKALESIEDEECLDCAVETAHATLKQIDGGKK